MRKLFLLLGLGLFVLASSCKTQNVGLPGNPNRFSITGVTFSTAAPVAGSDVTATINFVGQSGPFNFTVTFDNGVTPAVQTVTAPAGATSASLTFTLDSFLLVDDADGKVIKVTVTGTDANGSVGTVSGQFTVTGIPDQFPTITTTFNAATCTVTATVADADNDDVIVSITTPGTGVNTPANQTIVGGNGTADFAFSAADILAGADTDVTFTADDQHGGTATSTAHVTCPGLNPVADTLYAIPATASVTAAATEAAAEADPGAPCTIVVVTGDPANPFQYMTGVRITAPSASGFNYVKNSFNVGAEGGAADGVDGFWTAMNPSGYLLAPDSFYAPVDAGGGLTGIDFNVTPLGGSDVDTGSGALFNFKAFFTTAGTYDLGFQQTNVVNRTYYQDVNQAPDYFWGDITNVHAGVPSSVTVH